MLYKQVIHKIEESGLPVIVSVAHCLGGKYGGKAGNAGNHGIARHVYDLSSFLSDHYIFLTLIPINDRIVSIRILDSSFELVFNVELEYKKLVRTLHQMRVTRIHYHHLMGIHPRIKQLAADLGIAYDFTFHDYYTVCPQTQLCKDGIYCREKGTSVCNSCPNKAEFIDIDTWRDQSYQFLSQAGRLLAPSNDVKNRIANYYPDLKVTVLPHPELDNRVTEPDLPPLTPDRDMKILAMGHVAKNKGGYVAYECSNDALIRNLPLSFRLLGRNIIGLVENARLSLYGEYINDNAPNLIKEYDPDIIWFPALWPETFSYTLSLAMQTGIPIVSTDLGAFPERLRGYDAKIYIWESQAYEINNLFMSCRTNLGHIRLRKPESPFSITDFFRVYDEEIKFNKIPPHLKSCFVGNSLNRVIQK